MQTIITRNAPDAWGETKWVSAHVGELFGFAAEQFAAIGRGVVVLDLRSPNGKIAGYMPVAEIPEAESRRKVQQYDPANQTVLLIVGPSRQFRTVTISALFLQGPMN
jgi:hypothetical protein